MDALPQFYDHAYHQVAAVLERQGIQPQEAIGYYLGPPGETVDLEVGFTVETPVDAEGEVTASSLPGGDIARLTHHGSYDGLPAAYERLGAWVGRLGRRPAGQMWEVYVTEPSDADPSSMRTDLYWRLAP